METRALLFIGGYEMNIFETFVSSIGIVVLGIILVLLLSFLLAFPVIWLWNFAMVATLGVSNIGYWTAWGIYILAALLFRSGFAFKK